MFYVFGAGISGLAATQFLLLQDPNSKVVVIDDNITLDYLVSNLASFKNLKLARSTDNFDISDQDTLIPSPGISLDHHLILKFIKSGANIISEVELALSTYTGTRIAITGTNGKSTTTAMCDYLLKQLNYSSEAVGNIGLPPSKVLQINSKPKFLSIELSSYQLETSKNINAHVCIFTNFGKDHLDRHGTMKNYFDAKWNLILGSPNSPVIIDNSVKYFADSIGVSYNDRQIINIDSMCSWQNLGTKLNFHGEHNLKNAAMAIEAIHYITKIDRSILTDKLKGFKNLDHRCEIIPNPLDIKIINDSKSTNVESTITALNAFKEDLILILGGVAKKESFEGLTKFHQIKKVFVYGRSMDEILNFLNNDFSCVGIEKFEVAVEDALRFAKNHKINLLFSPGCASFDQFPNFEKRGEEFKNLCKKLL